jgi:LacI family transcriptional regulator
MSGVIGDTIQSAMSAVEHLIRQGNQAIAYIGGPAVSIDREFGYRKALTINGLPINEQLIKLGPGQSFDFGYEAMNELLETKELFTAVFCGNDLIAMGAMHALNKAGIRVPEEVGIIGYDDIHLASKWKPSLTTIRQPIKQISKELIKLLLSLIDNEEQRSMPKKIMVSNELVVRESCGIRLPVRR